MTAAHAGAVLPDLRVALRGAGLRQAEDCPGLPVLPDVETWISDGEVTLKITVAPEDRPGAAAVPARVQDALRSHGFTLAARSHDGPSPVAALTAGHAVGIVQPA